MTSYKGMPKGVLNINIIQAFSTVGFAALLGTLNLYLQKQGMPIALVDTLTASFFALNFLLQFLAGPFGGGYISFRTLFVVSLLLQALGFLAIQSSDLNMILAGLAAFITGSGLNVTCVNMMLTQRFKPDDNKRRAAFSVNYACMNLGFVASLLVANYFQIRGDYHATFMFALICLGIALMVHLINWKNVPDIGTYFDTTFSKKSARYFLAPVIILACFLSTLYLMHHANIASILVYVVFVIVVIITLRMASKVEHRYRNKIYAYMVLIAASMVFAFVQGLMSTGLQNFVAYNTNQSLFGLHIGPSGFSMFDSIGVVIFGFLLAKYILYKHHKGVDIPPEKFVARGLGFNIIAFLMIPLGIWFARSEGHMTVALLFPVLLLIIASMSEIHVNTTNYAMAGALGKPRHQGFLTGYLFLNIAVGINLSGPFSNLILGRFKNLAHVSPAQTNPLYFKAFIWVAVAAAIITITYYLLVPVIGRLRESKA